MSTRHFAAPPRTAAASDTFAIDVQYYLSLQPRQLPSRYLYDALGSALFEAICRLPWYAIARAELDLLARHGRTILGRGAPVSRIVELGPGNGEKLLKLVDGLAPRARPLELHLVDLSAAALEASTRSLTRLPSADVVTHQASYEAGLADATRRPSGGRTLALFLGSNIGNFDPPSADAFLRGIRAALAPGDLLLLGADLVKPKRDLLLAYDDPLGITAAFNRNLLVRINRELGGDLDLDRFGHRAVWNPQESRVEMHLVSQSRQRVRIAAAGLDFVMEEGEAIWTESSYKYRVETLKPMLERASFGAVGQWIDAERAFALTLAEAQ